MTLKAATSSKSCEKKRIAALQGVQADNLECSPPLSLSAPNRLPLEMRRCQELMPLTQAVLADRREHVGQFSSSHIPMLARVAWLPDL